jgi:hypothetical protein
MQSGIKEEKAAAGRFRGTSAAQGNPSQRAHHEKLPPAI